MYETLQRQTVAHLSFLSGPADGQRGNGHHQLRELQRVDNHLRHIDRCSQVAVTQSFLVHEVAQRLRIEQCIDGSILVRQEVVVARVCLALLTPTRGTSEVGTDGQHHRSALYHRLVEVCWCQPLFHLLTACHHHRIELQIAHGLRSGCLRHQSVQQFLRHFSFTILANGSPC